MRETKEKQTDRLRKRGMDRGESKKEKKGERRQKT